MTTELPNYLKVNGEILRSAESVAVEKIRRPIPTNEAGVVIPPVLRGCIGDECKFRNGKVTCLPNRHHLHSTQPTYEDAGDVAEDFRELSVLTVWMHECQHELHHGEHELDVEVPKRDIMRETTNSSKKLGKLVMNHSELKNINRILAESELTKRQKKGLSRRREVLLGMRYELRAAVEGIEVIPEELITGALLIVAPNLARARMLEGSSVVITGTIPKKDVSIATKLAKRNIAEAEIWSRQSTEIAA